MRSPGRRVGVNMILVALLGAASLYGQAPDPVAFINQPLVPTSVVPGSAAFTLTVNGTGFTPNSIVHWNGNARTLNFQFVSSSQVKVDIPDTDVAMATTAEVAVDNPKTGGGSIRSNIVFFHVTNPTTSVAMSKTDYAAGIGPYSVATQDFNGDGILDLATANLSGSTVSILLGNADGTFQPQTAFATGPSPVWVTTGDFNGDGSLDLAVANYGDSTVSILLGIGDGMFQAQTTFVTGSQPQFATAGDFNGDGSLDLAVANYGADTVSILLGNGNGTFQDQTTFATGNGPISSTAGDFNADGKLDLAVANASGDTVSILLGDGNGSFLPTVPPTFATGFAPFSVTTADFNADGKLDLAVANVNSDTVSILLGNGNGTFQDQTTFATGASPNSVTTGDFNGDGMLDLAVPNYSDDTVSVLLGDVDFPGTFQAKVDFATGILPWSVTTGDFNEDGRLDLAVANLDNSVSVLLQTPPSGPAVQLSTASLAFGDQVVTTTSGAMPVTLTNNGTATLNIASFNVQISAGNATLSPDFSQNNDCGTSLAALASCTINAFFNPTAVGPLSAVIKIVSDAPGSPHFISLSGTGTANPAILLSTGSVNFTGNPLNLTCPTKPVTITNTGDVPLDIVSISANGLFSVTHNCPATLGVEASCTALVKFTPEVVGSEDGTLTVTTNPATTGNTVNLTGNGTPACQLLARVRSVTVLRGTDVQDFAVEDAKPSCSPVELNLTCSVDNPAACLLSPAVIAPSGASTLKVSNLRRVGGDALQITVTSTSEFRTATELVTVRFADFAFTKSPDVATVAAGNTASYAVAIRPVNGLAGNLALACSGAPRGATCAVEPSSVSLDGTSLAQVKVKVSTAGRAGALPVFNLPSDWPWHAVPLLLGLMALLAVAAPFRAAHAGLKPGATRLVLATIMLAMLVWASCGGGGGSMNLGSNATPAGTYTLTITGTYSSATGATPGTLANSTTVTLKVN